MASKNNLLNILPSFRIDITEKILMLNNVDLKSGTMRVQRERSSECLRMPIGL